MSAPLVRLEDVRKAFVRTSGRARWLRRERLRVPILSGVTFEVEAGGRLALLGANGAGKTTVLKTIATLLTPDSGRVEVCGSDALKHGRQVRELASYVLADERSFHWRLTGRQNLEFFAALNGLSPTVTRQRIRRLLDRLDLSAAADLGFWQYSTGMKQRLAIARALLVRPRVLLMDEPTRSIDASHAAEAWQLVREEIDAAEGCLVLVTHQLQEAFSLCGRVAILADGKVALETATDALHAVTADLDGFTLTLRSLSPAALAAGQAFPGVRELRLCSQMGDEQVVELWAADPAFALGDFLGQLTASGATVCALQRTTPIQGVLQRLLSAPLVREVAR
ncbi:MAG: ABC transporter ATP-binding protein [Dehalococcoidia bacterium]|nr:ABC transporter ATP-binding protein [Dehalococcoidia bacterium]